MYMCCYTLRKTFLKQETLYSLLINLDWTFFWNGGRCSIRNPESKSDNYIKTNLKSVRAKRRFCTCLWGCTTPTQSVKLCRMKLLLGLKPDWEIKVPDENWKLCIGTIFLFLKANPLQPIPTVQRSPTIRLRVEMRWESGS